MRKSNFLIFFLVITMLLGVFGFVSGVNAETAELTFWDMMWGPGDSYPAAVKNLVNQFNEEHPNIQVEVEMIPWNGSFQAFLTAVQSGVAPDVATGSSHNPISYAAMGETLSLDPIIEEWRNEGVLDDFVSGSVDYYKYEGEHVGIPWNIDPEEILYRKDIFEEAGIEKLPETWDEFLDVCRKIKKNTDTIPFAFGVADNGGTHTVRYFNFTNGVGQVDKNLNPTFNDPRVIEVLKFFATLDDEGLIPEGIAGYTSSDVERLYLSGRVAIALGTNYTAVFDNQKIFENSGILPPFAGPHGQKRSLTWINGIQAFNQTKNPDAARTFIKWWLENNMKLWTEGKSTVFNARESFMKNEYFLSNHLTKGIINKVIPYVTPPSWPAESLYPAFAQIDGEHYPGMALQRILTGERDYEKITNDTNQKIKNAF